MATLTEKFEEFIIHGLIGQEADVPFDNTVDIFAKDWDVSKEEVRKVIYKAVENNEILIDYNIKHDIEMIRVYENDLDKLLINENSCMKSEAKIKELEQENKILRMAIASMEDHAKRIQDLEAIVVVLKTKQDD